MKAKSVFIGLFVVLALVSGLVLAGCSPDPGGGNPFVGTWNGVYPDYGVLRFVIEQSTWTASLPASPNIAAESGTFTYSGNTATFFQYGIPFGTATVSGNTMTATFSGYGTIVLFKQ